MSYAGPASRSRGTPRRSATSASPTRSIAASPVTGHPAPGEVDEEGEYHETDWQQVAIFGAGLALGLALGAGTALLTAPQSGEETRAALRGKARRFGRATSRRSRDAWDELRDELHSAKMALRRRRTKRAALRGRARRLGRSTSRRSRDAWAELRDELQSATMSLRRRRAKRAARRALQRELEREATGE